jgi:RHS repeat-associated protein
VTADGTTYNINLTYAATTGLLATLEYPISTSGYRLKLGYDYANGLLKRVKHSSGTPVYWEAVSTDAWGHVQDESFGNDVDTFTDFDQASGLMKAREGGVGGGTGLIHSIVDWDLNGNLKQRQDLKLSPAVTEDFFYDSLDRFDYSNRTAGGSPAINADVTLNAIGNISWKLGVGNYAYHATQKRAVVSAGSFSFGYDANGNMTSRNGSSISYTSYNLPAVINAGTGTSSTLSYGAFRNRYQQIAVTPTSTETTIYVAGLLEKVTRGGSIEYRHLIHGGKGAAAIYTRVAGGASSTYYLHRDHLGSPELITDSSGNEVVRPSFGAYGERRDGTDWNGLPSAADLTDIANISRRGFTGHEHLDSVGLIHMNGRVYEPIAGRFLGVDPILGIGSSQDVNSYSYGWNNPLSVTDPSGFAEHDAVEAESPCYSFPELCTRGDPAPGSITERDIDALDRYERSTEPQDNIAPNAVSDGESFGGPRVMFGAGSTGSATSDSTSLDEGVVRPCLNGPITDDLGIRLCDARGGEVLTIYVGIGGVAAVARNTIGKSLGLTITRVQASIARASLRRALERAGQMARPGDQAHHIVALRAEAAAPAREVLRKFGVELNEAANGVFLPSKSIPGVNTAVHSGGHPRAYYEYVNDALASAQSRQDVLEILREIRRGLSTGSIGL